LNDIKPVNLKNNLMLHAIHNFYKRLAILICLLSLIQSGQQVFCQQSDKSPKNFIGVFGGIEWNTISAGVGVDYERIVYTKRKITIGAKGIYLTRYKYGNIRLGREGGGNNDGSVSHLLVIGSVNFFTGKEADNTGFFLHTGLGAGINSFRYLTGNNYDQIAKRNSFTGAFEMGIGVQFYISRKICVRFCGTAIWGAFQGAFTLGKFSVGI
jgi:hypothetical protein